MTKTCKHPNCTITITQSTKHNKIFCKIECATDWHNNIRGKWQPISSCPKDGTPVFNYRGNEDIYHIYVGEFQTDSVTHWMPIPTLPKT